jgi:hypothetical protein
MPIFYLNVFNDVDAFDEEGIDRSSLEDARSEAIEGARDLIANQVRAGKPVYRSHRIQITDEAGKLLHIVLLGDIGDLRP